MKSTTTKTTSTNFPIFIYCQSTGTHKHIYNIFNEMFVIESGGGGAFGGVCSCCCFWLFIYLLAVHGFVLCSYCNPISLSSSFLFFKQYSCVFAFWVFIHSVSVCMCVCVSVCWFGFWDTTLQFFFMIAIQSCGGSAPFISRKWKSFWIFLLLLLVNYIYGLSYSSWIIPAIFGFDAFDFGQPTAARINLNLFRSHYTHTHTHFIYNFPEEEKENGEKENRKQFQ